MKTRYNWLALFIRSLFHRVGDIWASITRRNEREMIRHLTTYYPDKADEIKRLPRE